jgi:lysozyme
MEISEQGLALIRRFEGFSAKPYTCAGGKRTIGYGHVIGPKERFPREGLTREAAEILLKQDAEQAAAAVRRNVEAPLRQHEFDALVSFVFNVGADAFARSTLKNVINRGWHEEAPAQFARWIFAGGKAQPGLVARRRAEGVLYSGK